jgi:hypothetical protein
MLDAGLYPIGPITANTGQFYQMSYSDLCNPYLWLGLGSPNQSITGLKLLTTDLGNSSRTTYADCAATSSPFSLTWARVMTWLLFMLCSIAQVHHEKKGYPSANAARIQVGLFDLGLRM